MTETAFFLAVMVTALALGGGLAHAYELMNKMKMSRDEYLVTQQAYRGWNLFAVVVALQVALIGWIAIRYLGRPEILLPALAALACIAASQAIFWMFTFPVNQATERWTRVPDDWEALRRRWEYSHLAGALFQLLALAALVIALLARASG